MVTRSFWKPTTRAIGIPGIPGSSSRVAHSVAARVMMAKVVMSLGMGTREGGARQGEKSDRLEEHVGWMMPSGCYKVVWCLNELSLGSGGGFL
jgi:hypothetical protein